ENTKPIQVPALSSTIFATFNEKELIAPAAADSAFAVFDLLADGKVISRNTQFFDRMRNLNLPASPAITSDLKQTSDGYSLTLASPQLARHVFVSFGDLEAQVSDNYFDLL